MKAPKTIYLTTGDYDNEPDFSERFNESICWCCDKITKHDVEYIRKDLYDKLKERYNNLKSFTEHPYSCQMGGDSI